MLENVDVSLCGSFVSARFHSPDGRPDHHHQVEGLLCELVRAGSVESWHNPETDLCGIDWEFRSEHAAAAAYHTILDYQQEEQLEQAEQADKLPIQEYEE